MSEDNKRVVRQRAKQIRKATKAKLSTQDYLQRAVVVLIIAGILALASAGFSSPPSFLMT